MELEDETPPQAGGEVESAAEERSAQRWQAEPSCSDGEALALHEI